MRIPARAAGPLVAMAIAIASFGCIAPAAYAENATAAVISDDGGHVVVDVDLNGSAPVGDATEQADMKSSQGESVSNAEPDEALKAFEALMTANADDGQRHHYKISVLLHLTAVSLRDGLASPLIRIAGAT